MTSVPENVGIAHRLSTGQEARALFVEQKVGSFHVSFPQHPLSWAAHLRGGCRHERHVTVGQLNHQALLQTPLVLVASLEPLDFRVVSGYLLGASHRSA